VVARRSGSLHSPLAAPASPTLPPLPRAPVLHRRRRRSTSPSRPPSSRRTRARAGERRPAGEVGLPGGSREGGSRGVGAVGYSGRRSSPDAEAAGGGGGREDDSEVWGRPGGGGTSPRLLWACGLLGIWAFCALQSVRLAGG
jgi:hypothetical protein